MAREVTGLTVAKSAPQRVGPSQAVPLRHLLLATVVVAVWGSNFVVVKLALAHLPPLLMAALRFTLAAFPAVLFIRRPATSWRHLAVYGLLLVGQFGLLYLALNGHIAPGLASLVIQAQVFFTIVLSTVFFAEHIRTAHLLLRIRDIARAFIPRKT